MGPNGILFGWNRPIAVRGHTGDMIMGMFGIWSKMIPA